MISIEENLGRPSPAAPVKSYEAHPDKPPFGQLSEKSMLRQVFAAGIVPLKSPFPRLVSFPLRAPFMAYIIDLDRVTVDQFNKLAQQVHERTHAPLNSVLKVMVEDRLIPISTDHIEFAVIAFPHPPDSARKGSE